MALGDKLVNLDDLKVVGDAVGDLKSNFNTGLVDAFPDRSTWYNCYFGANGAPTTNAKNVSPTNAPFLLHADETLYVDPDIYTGNLFTYTESGGTYTRKEIVTFTAEKTISFAHDTYITLHFGSGNDINKLTASCTIRKDSRIDTAIKSITYYEKTLESRFYPSGDYKYYYSRYGKLPIGEFIISQIPASPSMQFAIRGFSDGGYTTKVYDSGWQKIPISVSTDGNTYYDIYTMASNSAQIFDFSIFDDFIIKLKRPVTVGLSATERETDKIAEHGAYRNFAVKSIAHRGDSVDAPECTASAYISAKKHGFNIAENDVFKTADDVYMCWHDDTLSKCGNLLDINGYLMYTDGADFYYYNPIDAKLYTWNGSAYVESEVSVGSLTRCAGGNYTVAQMNSTLLKRIDVGVYKGTKFAGTQMLTFAEWVLLCKKLGMEMYLDTKVSHTQETIDDWLEILDTYGMRNHASWLSVFVPLTAYLKEADSNARIGFLTAPTQELVEAYTIYNTGRGIFFNPAIADVTSEKVMLGAQAGFDVECWYANGTTAESTVFSTVNAAIANGVSGVTMDHYKVEDIYADLLN